MSQATTEQERKQLRELARAAASGKHPDIRSLSPEEVEILVHEFGVYQVELESQNEALRETQLALEETRDRYRELYDFAPVGYFTLSRSGKIRAANLTGCALLGVERTALLGRFLPEFLTREAADDLYRHLGLVLATGERQSLDVVLPGMSGAICTWRASARPRASAGRRWPISPSASGRRRKWCGRGRRRRMPARPKANSWPI
jgi:PAS domain S-box-containing protein